MTTAVNKVETITAVTNADCIRSSAVTIQFISRIPISNNLKIEIFLWSNRFRFRFLGIRV